MNDMVLYFDIAIKKWQRCSSHIADTDMVKPIIMCCDDLMLLYCDGKWEIVAFYDGLDLRTTAGTRAYGVPAFFVYENNISSYRVPTLWRIRFSPSKEVVVIYSEYYDIQMPDNSNHLKEVKIKHNDGNCTYKLADGKCYSFREYEPPSREVIIGAYEILQAEAEKEGRNLLEILWGGLQVDDYLQVFMRAILYGFYDGNRFYLHNCFKDMNFIPFDCTDIYPYMCEKLQIDPSDEIKNLYGKNPYVLPMYRALLDLGFHDMQYMKMVLIGNKIGPIDFANLNVKLPFVAGKYELDPDALPEDYYIDIPPNDGLDITEEEIDALLSGGVTPQYQNKYKIEQYKEWKSLKFVVRNFIDKKGENAALKYLQQYTSGNALIWQNDFCRLIHEWYEDIPSELLEMFWEKGLEREVYDQLVAKVIVPVFKRMDNHMD